MCCPFLQTPDLFLAVHRNFCAWMEPDLIRWNMPDTERQMPPYLIHVSDLKILGSRGWEARGQGQSRVKRGKAEQWVLSYSQEGGEQESLLCSCPALWLQTAITHCLRKLKERGLEGLPPRTEVWREKHIFLSLWCEYYTPYTCIKHYIEPIIVHNFFLFIS